MNEELQSKLVEIIVQIQQGVGTAKDFAVEQLPDIVAQYLMFGRAWAVLDLLAILTVLGLCVWAVAWGIKDSNKPRDKQSTTESQIAAITIGGMCGIIVVICTWFSVKNLLLVWLAPKVWLLQELGRLVI